LVLGLLLLCADRLVGSHTLRDPANESLSAPTRPKRLNNGVLELLSLKMLPPRAYAEWSFINPRDGWVFVCSTANLEPKGKVWIWVESFPKKEAPLPEPDRQGDNQADVWLAHDKSGTDAQEAMRFLPAGEHKLSQRRQGHVWAQDLVVRAIPELIVCLGYMSMPTTETLNLDPCVDYKVWMDMQFQHIATHRAFRDFYGLMEYTCGYADDETVRWATKLYRHYGIEGKTELLSSQYGFKYHLDHIKNPDFAEGAKGWTVEPAEPGAVNTNSLKGFGWLQGRYPRTAQGDSFLWTRRGADKPNLVSQEIKNLAPGRLYSLKMVTADYQDILQGRSLEQRHAVTVELHEAALVPEKSFQQPMPNNYAHGLGPFNDQHKAWMNYHYHVFRAARPTATLTISDWLGPAQPGGPIGQELMYNFIEAQPYLGD
jgi:hypothetical protein